MIGYHSLLSTILNHFNAQLVISSHLFGFVTSPCWWIIHQETKGLHVTKWVDFCVNKPGGRQV